MIKRRIRTMWKLRRRYAAVHRIAFQAGLVLGAAYPAWRIYRLGPAHLLELRFLAAYLAMVILGGFLARSFIEAVADRHLRARTPQ